MRGARDRHERCGEMRWMPNAQLTSAHEADGEVVWFGRPKAGVSSVVEPRDDGDKSGLVHRGEHEVSRKTIAQGKPGCFRLHLWSYPGAFCCTGPMGAIGTRLSLRPLHEERAVRQSKLGQFMSRERELTSSSLSDNWIQALTPSLRGAKRRGNPSLRICCSMDCFADARNDEGESCV